MLHGAQLDPGEAVEGYGELVECAGDIVAAVENIARKAKRGGLVQALLQVSRRRRRVYDVAGIKSICRTGKQSVLRRRRALKPT